MNYANSKELACCSRSLYRSQILTLTRSYLWPGRALDFGQTSSRDFGEVYETRLQIPYCQVYRSKSMGWLDSKSDSDSTWRPLLPVIEDRPLAFCDSRTVDPRDLVVADRIFPHQEFELYFLKHNPKQSWHWLSNHNRSELIIMLMYDTQPGGARCTSTVPIIVDVQKLTLAVCPHGSFDNPLARNSAPPRQSVETRSVVVTRE